MPSEPPIRVLLFARYAELVGREHLELAGGTVPTVGGVVEHIRSLPGGGRIPAAPLVAVNMRQATLDTPVRAGDEIALLPPLAGG